MFSFAIFPSIVGSPLSSSARLMPSVCSCLLTSLPSDMLMSYHKDMRKTHVVILPLISVLSPLRPQTHIHFVISFLVNETSGSLGRDGLSEKHGVSGSREFSVAIVLSTFAIYSGSFAMYKRISFQ